MAQPRSQSTSAISDVTSPVNLVGKIRARFQASSGHSDSANRPGYEAACGDRWWRGDRPDTRRTRREREERGGDGQTALSLNRSPSKEPPSPVQAVGVNPFPSKFIIRTFPRGHFARRQWEEPITTTKWQCYCTSSNSRKYGVQLHLTLFFHGDIRGSRK